MIEIDKDKALDLYLKKLDIKESKFKEEIISLFNLLNEEQILKLFDKKNINYVKEIGFDEKEFKKLLDKVNNRTYFLVCKITYDNWHEEDYSYYDPFDLSSKFETIFEHVSCLYKDKEYKEANRILQELNDIKIEINTSDEYDNEVYYDSCSLSDMYYYLSERETNNKITKLKFALQFMNDYNFDSLNQLLKDYEYLNPNSFDEALSLCEDKNRVKEQLRTFFYQYIDSEQIRIGVIDNVVDYLDDIDIYEDAFKRFDFNRDSLFDRLYNCYLEHDINPVSRIIDALPLLQNSSTKDRYYQILIDEFPEEDKYKIEAYKNLDNEINFFNLYRIKDLTIIPSLVKNNVFHRALVLQKEEDIKGLTLEEITSLLGLFNNRPLTYINKVADKELISRYRRTINVTDKLLKLIIETSINLLENYLEEILGVDRKSYSYAASRLYNVDFVTGFKLGIRYTYTTRYQRYRAFVKTVDEIYSMRIKNETID